MASPIHQNDFPDTLDSVLTRGSKWFVDSSTDQYALIFTDQEHGLKSRVYTYAELHQINPRLPDTLRVLALCGAVSQEIHTGLKKSFNFWDKAPSMLVPVEKKLSNRYFKDWQKLYTENEALVIEARCYQVVKHPDVEWPVVKPWISKVTTVVDPVAMDELYPGFISSVEAATVLGLNPQEAAHYCQTRLHLDSQTIEETITAPYDIA